MTLLLFRETADVSSESEDEIEVGGGRGKHDLLVKQESKPGFFKQSKKQHPMFPFVEEKIKIDEYGEIIRYFYNNHISQNFKYLYLYSYIL